MEFISLHLLSFFSTLLLKIVMPTSGLRKWRMFINILQNYYILLFHISQQKKERIEVLTSKHGLFREDKIIFFLNSDVIQWTL